MLSTIIYYKVVSLFFVVHLKFALEQHAVCIPETERADLHKR